MSQNSRASAGSRVVGDNETLGVPYFCRCTRKVSLRYSKSEGNPNRRYFRCDLAYEQKLANDNHLFRWLDDALLQEVTILSSRTLDLQKDISDIYTLLKDIADSEMEANREVEKMKLVIYAVVGAVVGAVTLLGLSKLI